MVIFRVVLVLAVFTLLLVVGLPNARGTVSVELFGRSHIMYVAELMLYAFAFGAACVGVFSLASEIQLRTRLRRQRREIDALTEELHAFRNAPLEDSPPAGAGRTGYES